MKITRSIHMRFVTGLTCLFFVTMLAMAQGVDMDVPFVTTPPAVSEAMLTIAGVG